LDTESTAEVQKYFYSWRNLTSRSSVMLKAVGQALFSTGLQNPKFTAEQKKVNISQLSRNKRQTFGLL